MFENLSIIEMLLACFGAIIIFVLGFKIGKLLADRRGKREMKLIDKERHSSDRSFKKLLDEEQVEVGSENKKLKKSNAKLMDIVGEYRAKLAGLGKFSLANKRKRADLLYSLLLENEVLEQLLVEQSKKEPDEKSGYLLHQMKQVEKRHQIMAKIFDHDEMIKTHVMNILFKNGSIESLEADTEHMGTVETPVKDENVAELILPAK